MSEPIVISTEAGPEFLYRYGNLQGDQIPRLKRTLLNEEIFLASPASFNDPFDCHLNLQFEGTAQQWREHYDQELRISKPELGWVASGMCQ